MKISERETHKKSPTPAMHNFPIMSGDARQELPQELLQIALTSADTILYQWDVTTGEIGFSDNMGQVFPFDAELPTCAETWLELVPEEDRLSLLQQFECWKNHPNQTSNYRYRLCYKEKTVWIRQSGVAVDDGSRIVGIMYFNCTPPSRDLRGIRVSSVRLPAQPQTDSEYTYPELLVSKLQTSIDRAVNEKSEGVFLVLSIVNFAMILNAYGHQTSECISKEIASEIRSMLEDNDNLYRLQRDQFAIIINHCAKSDIEKQIAKICALIEEYGYKSSIGDLHAICAVGTATFPNTEGENDATPVIDHAYAALHRSGEHGQIPMREMPAEQKAARQQMGLANYLRKAIHENKLRLAFQPVIASKNGEVAYYEALLRLIGEDGRISSAGPLIPVAEKMGLIDMVDHMVLDMAFNELDRAPQARLAINVSNVTTENPNWLRHFQGLLRNRPDIASRLIIEITETAAQRDMRRTAYFVASMQEMGCTVALDDFGSGYTSFRQLKALSVDMVKIDGSFVKDMVQKSDNLFFVKTLLEFTRCFGLESVAEFVETGETAKALMELGVDYQQGYYFGKPENYRGWLAPHQE